MNLVSKFKFEETNLVSKFKGQIIFKLDAIQRDNFYQFEIQYVGLT